MDKEDMVHRYNRILLNYKKEWVMPFAAPWMDLEIIILREVSQAEEDNYQDITQIRSLELTYTHYYI